MVELSKAFNSAPKVCFLLESYFPMVGGMETQVRLVAEGLVGNGFQVIIVTSCSNPMGKTEIMGNIVIHRVPHIIVNGLLKRWKMAFTCLPTLVKSRREYDVIFVSGFRTLGIPAVLTSKIFDKACVLKADNNGEVSGDFLRRV